MCDGSAVHIDDVLRQPEFGSHRQRNGRERLIDFDALDVTQRPLRTLQCLAYRGHGPQAKQARLDGAHQR